MKTKLSLCVLIILLVGVFCTSCQNVLTDEERAERNSPQVYEVCSVAQYIKIKTGRFGDVISQDTAYTFTYLDKSGDLCQLDNFVPTKYGTKKLQIGDKNEYIVENDTCTLYLNQDTLSNLKVVGGE